jgi:hypothetical protein
MGAVVRRVQTHPDPTLQQSVRLQERHLQAPPQKFVHQLLTVRPPQRRRPAIWLILGEIRRPDTWRTLYMYQAPNRSKFRRRFLAVPLTLAAGALLLAACTGSSAPASTSGSGAPSATSAAGAAATSKPTNAPASSPAAASSSPAAASSSPAASPIAAASPVAAAGSPAAAAQASPAASAKVSANDASIAQLQQAFEAAGIPNAARWAREVDEYRPYPTNDPGFAKLRQELSKYNPSPDVLEKIIATLSLT